MPPTLTMHFKTLINLFSFAFITIHSSSFGATDELEIDGLILDRSISRFGHQFYFEFANYWRDLPSTAGFNIEIKETVLPRAGTKLTLIMNNQIVYITYLGRRLEPIDDRVEQALYSVMDAMARSNLHKASPDMAKNGW